jgi:hypothetical protein
MFWSILHRVVLTDTEGLDKLLRKAVMVSARMYLGATSILELLALVKNFKQWAKRIQPPEAQPKAIRAWIAEPGNLEKAKSALARCVVEGAAVKQRGKKQSKLDDSDEEEDAPREEQEDESSSDGKHRKKARGKDKKAKARKQKKAQTSEEESSSEPPAAPKPKGKRKGGTLASSSEEGPAKKAKHDKKKDKKQDAPKPRDDPVEAAFAAWPRSDVQAGAAKIDTLERDIGTLAGGKYDIAEVIALQALVPDVVLEACPKLALALVKSPASGLVANEAARTLLLLFKGLFEKAGKFLDTQSGAGAGSGSK